MTPTSEPIHPALERLPDESDISYANFLEFVASNAMTVIDFVKLIEEGKARPRGTLGSIKDRGYRHNWMERKSAAIAAKMLVSGESDVDIAERILKSELRQVTLLENLFDKMAQDILARLEAGTLRPKPSDLVSIANAFSTIGRRTARLPESTRRSEASLTVFRGFDGDFSQRSLPEQVEYLKQIASSSLSVTEKVAPESEIIDGTILEEKNDGHSVE